SRILHLPLAPNESVDYSWNYTGGEPSQIFFKGSSFAYSIGLETTDARLHDLIRIIHSGDSESIQKALGSLNIGWVVIHNETEWRNRGLESPERINQWV